MIKVLSLTVIFNTRGDDKNIKNKNIIKPITVINLSNYPDGKINLIFQD